MAARLRKLSDLAPFVAGRTVHPACWTRQGPTCSPESLTVRGPAETIAALK